MTLLLPSKDHIKILCRGKNWLSSPESLHYIKRETAISVSELAEVQAGKTGVPRFCSVADHQNGEALHNHIGVSHPLRVGGAAGSLLRVWVHAGALLLIQPCPHEGSSCFSKAPCQTRPHKVLALLTGKGRRAEQAGATHNPAISRSGRHAAVLLLQQVCS